MFKLSVASLISWMAETQVDPVITEMVRSYLLAQGECTMQDFVILELKEPEYQQLAQETDSLRWDCFIEGRATKLWIDIVIVTPQLKESQLFLSPNRWGLQFLEYLLVITHRQWIFRNSKVHLQKLGGLTEAEDNDIFDRMDELILTPPEDLLPTHRHNLDVDFGAMGEGSAASRQY